jgi:hypothetical protein
LVKWLLQNEAYLIWLWCRATFESMTGQVSLASSVLDGKGYAVSVGKPTSKYPLLVLCHAMVMAQEFRLQA